MAAPSPGSEGHGAQVQHLMTLKYAFTTLPVLVFVEKGVLALDRLSVEADSPEFDIFLIFYPCLFAQNPLHTL